MKNCFRFIFLFFFLVSIDRFLKFIFLEESACNKNLAWSIPIASGVFYFFWLIIFFFLVYYLLKSENVFEKTSLVFILSGAVSNLIDRIVHGCVIDFIDLKFWPVFNSADIYITIGVAMLIIKFIKINRPA
jgi:signal peptidase II